MLIACLAVSRALVRLAFRTGRQQLGSPAQIRINGWIRRISAGLSFRKTNGLCHNLAFYDLFPKHLFLDWCFGNGVKFDFRNLPDGHVVTPDEIDAELARIGHALQPLDIVVVNTSAGAAYGAADYLMKGCGFGRDATNHLTSMGVRMVGTDAWSWDAPFGHTAQAYAKTGDASIIWEGHRAGMDQGYCQIEKMANLDLLPDTGFTVSAFPFKIKAASAGFTRAVAIIDA